VDFPAAIAVDKTAVYWTEASMHPAVRRIALAGGEPVTLAMGGNLSPEGMVIDATNVYWTNTAPPGSIMKWYPLHEPHHRQSSAERASWRA
jgi:hypothetical protein